MSTIHLRPFVLSGVLLALAGCSWFGKGEFRER